jgi:hypothetical protein
MVRLWRQLIAPLLDTVPVTNIVEVGSEEGKGTKALLAYAVKHRAVLHTIDPAPAFDPEALGRSAPSHFRFYRDLSLNVIPALPLFDIVLLDGDHNWYTVINELRQIGKLHSGDESRFPIVLLHDIGWPYGRRDLYYNPDTIPSEFRQPWARHGILPNQVELSEESGLNAELCNAVRSGGPRNGVLTAVEDYLQETSLPLEFVKLPLYYGLGIVMSRARLAANRRLAQYLDELSSAPGLLRVCELGEHIRCVETIFFQATARRLKRAETALATLGPGRPSEPAEPPAVNGGEAAQAPRPTGERA